MDEHTPHTEPSGALIPPPRNPPTALATSGSMPSASRIPARIKGLRGFVDSVLDRLDTLADRIADAAGLR